jgi:hypothetical protein
MTQIYIAVTALLFVILLLILCWISLALITPYFPDVKKVVPVGCVFMLLTAIAGGTHVA